jgi:hypothetical protein
LHGLIEPFYGRLLEASAVSGRGQIYEDQPIYLPMKWGLRVKRTDPTTDRILESEITGRSEDIFNHPPVTSPKVASSEGLIVGKAKLRRPVLVLAEPGFELAGNHVRQSEGFLCAPIYGADQFDESIRKRVRAYEFANLFYMPASSSPPFDEGFLRFDHLQTIRRDVLKRRRDLILSDDALAALEEWLFHYLTGRLPQDSLVAAYRQDELSKL